MRLFRWILCLAVCLSWPATASALTEIFVSVAPLKYFAQKVGGEHVRVSVMVQPGHSPATYEPTPKQMAQLADSDLYIRVGVPFEITWMEKIQSANPRLRIADARNGIDLQTDHTAVGGHGHGGQTEGDPHVWLDPALGIIIARTIQSELTRLDPKNSESYSRGASALIAELEQLDSYIRGITSSMPNRKFVVFHPAWGYFARAYALQQIAIAQDGKTPNPRALARLVDLIEREQIRTVFVQKQFSTKAAEALAEEVDARVVVLDPLAEDYIDNLRRAAGAIAGLDVAGNG